MKTVVIYESRTGNTATAAALISEELIARGHEAPIFSTEEVDLKTLADADVAIVGTWTDGLVLFGQRPGGAGHLAKYLPTMWDKPTYTYVTYAIRPGNVLRGLAKLLESKGANVRGGLELNRKRLEQEAANYADAVLEAFAA